MSRIGQEYRTATAYFIAGGQALKTIHEYEDDVAGSAAQLKAVARRYGADSAYTGTLTLAASHKLEHKALSFAPAQSSEGFYMYRPNLKTEAGRRLDAQLRDIPQLDLAQRIFSRRLTGLGDEEIKTNPDGLFQGDLRRDFEARASRPPAMYAKYGNVYVIEVPIVVRAIFNDAAGDAPEVTGHRYDWFTPPDSRQIPYSQVVALQEAERGNQLKKHTVSYGGKSQAVIFRPQR